MPEITSPSPASSGPPKISRTRNHRSLAKAAPLPADRIDGRYFQELALKDLFESPMNPRKRFDAAGLAELTDSIRQRGILTPLLVRPVPGWYETPLQAGRRYEIAAGHRRLRAARTAGLESVPAVAREMTDAELLEVLVIENDQREDVHPLEEAAGYQALMRTARYDVARIAERVGRSVKYVYDRVKLLTLTKKAQQLFLDGKITAGHAILLARLKPEEQQRAIASERSSYGRVGGLFVDEHRPADPNSVIEEEQPRKAVSVRELQAWIDEQVKFDRDQVDPMLFPETAATLAQAKEKALKVVPITHDYRPSDDVREASKERVYGQKAWKRADGRGKFAKACERARIGVVVCGPGRSEAFPVCIDKERCSIHWAKEQREKKRRAAEGAKAAPTSRDRFEAERRKREEERALQEAEAARWKKARPAILEAVAERVKKAPARSAGFLAQLVVRACDQNWGSCQKEATRYVPRGTTAEDLVRHAAFLTLLQETRLYRAPQEFPKRARALGVDVRKIVDAAAPKPAVQTSAQKPAAKK